MKSLLYEPNNPLSRRALANHLDYIDDLNKGKVKEYMIQIKENKPVRSTDANAYYWVLLMHIAVASGHNKDELHEFYKKKFNGKVIMGEQVGMTTTEMDSSEFSVYVKQVKTHGEDFFGLTIRDPRDKYYNVWEQQTKDSYNAMYAAS